VVIREIYEFFGIGGFRSLIFVWEALGSENRNDGDELRDWILEFFSVHRIPIDAHTVKQK